MCIDFLANIVQFAEPTRGEKTCHCGDRRSGRGGQFIFVFPALQMVAVFRGWNDNALGVQPFDVLQRYTLPAATRPFRAGATLIATHPVKMLRGASQAKRPRSLWGISPTWKMREDSYIYVDR